jgi:hypothetical protein
MSHLYGAILKPSHTDRFTDWWTSSLQDTLVSHSLPQASEQVKTIHDTSGLGLQTEFDFFGQDSASLKMSKDTSASDSAKSSESWEQSVTRRRGEYSARVKSARLTSASGSSSWPTVQASEEKANRYRDGSAKGTQIWLTTAVMKHGQAAPANWSTPNTLDTMPPKSMEGIQRVLTHDGRKNRKSTGNLREDVVQFGLPAPANHSTLGSRQGLSEQSQRNWQTFAHGTHNRGETPHRQVVKALVNGDKAKTQCLTVDQVFAEEIKGTNVWPTITAHTPDMESSGPNGNSGTYLAGAVKQWATPNAFCYQPPENTEKWTKRAEYQQTEKGVNLHKPIQTQVLHEVEKQWRTPSSSDGEGGVMEMREGCAGKYKLRDHVVAEQKSWATPIMGDSHLASTPEVAQKRIEEGKVTLSRQTAAWATPQLQDGHNINQDSTTHKTIPAQLTKMNMAGKLNPRWVETLMGLPVGWVMPSCASPVTIELTSCDSSATESSLPQPSELFAF